MTNPAADTRANAQAKWPGATVSARGKKHITHQHPTEPNRFMLDTAIGPMHYGAGEDQEIDTAWQTTTGAWQYEMTTNDWQTFARDTFNAGDIFEFQKDGEWVRFDPQSINWIDENTSRQQIAIKQAVSAVVNDDILSFPEGYGPGRHFQYQNQTARLQKLITIDSASDLPAVTLQGNTIWFEAEFTISHSGGVEVYLNGQLWQKKNGVRVQTSDRIEFRDEATGASVFWHLDFPRAWDSDESEVIGQMEVRRQGGPSSLFITVRIPKTWIDTAVFPIFIDPTIEEEPAANLDDVDEIISSGNVADNGFNVLVSTTSSSRIGAVRFPVVPDIATGDTVDVAYVDVRVQNNTYDDPNLDLYGEDTGDAAIFTTTNSDVSNRTFTTATVSWIATGVGQGVVSTPSIVSIIDEIISHGSWVAGNAMAIFFQDIDQTTFFRFYSFNRGSTLSLLHIEYTAAGGAIQLAATIAWQSATPDVTSLAIQRQLAATGTWQSTTSDTASLGIRRQLSSVVAWQSTTNDSADLLLTKSLSAVIGWTSSTPDTVSLAIQRQLSATSAWQTTAPDTSSLIIQRQLSAAPAWQSATPDDAIISTAITLAATVAWQTTTTDPVSLVIQRQLSATLTWLSDTSDTASLGVQRQLAASSDWQSATNDAASLIIQRQLAAIVAWQSSTPDDAVLSISGIIQLAAAIGWQSATPDTSSLAIARQLAAVSAWQSSTSDTAGIVILRQLAAIAAWQTSTPDTSSLVVLRQLAASLDWQTSTPDNAALVIARQLAASIDWQTLTPDDAILSISGIIQLAAAIAWASATNDTPSLAIQRQLAAVSAWQSATPDDAAIGLLAQLSAVIAGQTETSDAVSLAILRGLSAVIAGQTATRDSALLAIQRQLSASIDWQTATPDDAELIAAVIQGFIYVVITSRQPWTSPATRAPSATGATRSPSAAGSSRSPSATEDSRAPIATAAGRSE